jgi:hypothetical protein
LNEKPSFPCTIYFSGAFGSYYYNNTDRVVVYAQRALKEVVDDPSNFVVKHYKEGAVQISVTPLAELKNWVRRLVTVLK